MERKIKLRFWGDMAGFSLRDPLMQGDIFKLDDYEELGDQTLHDSKGHVVFMADSFMDAPPGFLGVWIREARRLNIPGLYTVPELGVKDAPFWKALEAVKAYYEEKAEMARMRKAA